MGTDLSLPISALCIRDIYSMYSTLRPQNGTQNRQPGTQKHSLNRYFVRLSFLFCLKQKLVSNSHFPASKISWIFKNFNFRRISKKLIFSISGVKMSTRLCFLFSFSRNPRERDQKVGWDLSRVIFDPNFDL